jgi:hypothetical protein
VSETPIEIDVAGLDSFEDLIFTDQYSTCGERFLRRLRVGGTDDTDSGFGLDGVRESDHVTDDGTVSLCAQANVQLVFLECDLATDFGGSDDSVKRMSIDMRFIGLNRGRRRHTAWHHTEPIVAYPSGYTV